MKRDIFYCWDCGKDTVHNLIKRESMAENMGPVRIIAAVFSLGMTEYFGTKFYQCSCCGKIIEKD